MNTNESMENDPIQDEPIQSAEELLRLTSRTRSHTDERNAGSREAFVALGETLESAIADFDWKIIAARLESEIATDIAQNDLVHPRDSQFATQLNMPARGRTFAWLGLSTAMVLLIALTLGLTLGPSTGQFAKRNSKKSADEKSTDKKLDLTAPAIDSWAQPPTANEANSPWNDEIDVKLVATQRALNQGRDPWVGDEPALSEVFAQIDELTTGLAFEPF